MDESEIVFTGKVILVC